MVNAVAAFGFPVLYLALAFTALDLSTFLNSQHSAGTTTCGEAPLLDSAAEVPPLAALGVLFVAIALIYHHLMSRHIAAVPVAGAGNGRLSISGLAIFALCFSAGTLELIVFGQAAGGGGGGGAGHRAQARALGLAALRAMPGAATVTFFCGTILIVAGVAHVRAAGEAGGTGAVAGDGRLLRLLTNVAAGAAAALVGLMVMALVLHGPEY